MHPFIHSFIQTCQPRGPRINKTLPASKELTKQQRRCDKMDRRKRVTGISWSYLPESRVTQRAEQLIWRFTHLHRGSQAGPEHWVSRTGQVGGGEGMLQTLRAAMTVEERRGQQGPLELGEERVVNLRQDAAAWCWWLGCPLGFGL